MTTMRGQPTHGEVMARLLDFWDRYDQPFVRLLSNILASAGYTTDRYADVLFMGIPDSELMRAMDAWEKTLRSVGEWEDRPS